MTDYNELRIATLELLIVELITELRGRERNAIKRRLALRFEMDLDPEERSIRMAALEWITEAEERYCTDDSPAAKGFRPETPEEYRERRSALRD